MHPHYILPAVDDTTPPREFPIMCTPSNTGIAFVNMKLAAEGAALVMIAQAQAALRS